VEHQRIVVVQRPAFPLGVDRMQADRVLVVGDDVVGRDREGATGQVDCPVVVGLG